MKTAYNWDYAILYLHGNCADKDSQSTTWTDRPTYDWKAMNLQSAMAKCDHGCMVCNHCVQWDSSTADQTSDSYTTDSPVYDWTTVILYLHLIEGSTTDIPMYDWRYEKAHADYPTLPDILPVTDENVMTVAWISARTAMRTMCKIGRNMSYAMEVRRQDKRAEIIMDIMGRMDTVNGRLQTLAHHKKAKVGGVWIPVDSYKLVLTSAGKKHDDMYTAISDTLGDYFPIYNEAVCGILQGIQDNDYSNVWDAFADGCRAVHKYVDGQRAYRDRVYHKQHADSDIRQDENGNEIKAYHDEDENGHAVQWDGMIESVQDDIAIAQYIDQIAGYFSRKRGDYVRQVLWMSVDGYSRKDIAIMTGNKPHVVYDIFRKAQEIIRRHDIIPADSAFRLMTK